MADTLTANYNWTKPDPGADDNTWGNTLNADLDSIDAQMLTATGGNVPIGAVVMWLTATPPANWLLLNGQALAVASYPALFAIFQYSGGGSGATFNLPNMSNVFPFGANGATGLLATGGEATHTLVQAEMPSHVHPIVDPSHGHAAFQNPHAHGIATGGHAHSISTGGHAHSGVVTGLSGGGTGNIAGALGGGNLIMGDTDPVGDLGGATSTVGNLGGNTDVQQPGVGVYNNVTGINGTQLAGSDGAHNNIPPYLGVNFIVKYA
jgi:microcystin-dependent protein